MRNDPILKIKTIGQLHKLYQLGSPKHPHISVIDLESVPHDLFGVGTPFCMEFYVISCKKFIGTVNYGRSNYDFEGGTMMFTAPDQVVSSASETQVSEGWALFFHSDLIKGTDLEKKMHEYSFFRYEANEALHITDKEQEILLNCITNLKRECSNNLDEHSKTLISSNIELLLNYCSRFYDRQFRTRKPINHDIVIGFERLLGMYFSDSTNRVNGLPNVKYFSERLEVSPNYLSDLLTRYTGKSTLEHIHLHIVERAKSLLWNTNKSVSEVAFDLGFEYPSHFSKIFKSNTGTSPKKFRNLNGY